MLPCRTDVGPSDLGTEVPPYRTHSTQGAAGKLDVGTNGCVSSKNARGEKEPPTVTAQGPLDPDLKINCKNYKTIWKLNMG